MLLLTRVRADVCSSAPKLVLPRLVFIDESAVSSNIGIWWRSVDGLRGYLVDGRSSGRMEDLQC